MNNQLSFILCAISNVSFVLAWITQSHRIKLSFRTMKILYLLLLTISVISYYVAYAFITDDDFTFTANRDYADMFSGCKFPAGFRIGGFPIKQLGKIICSFTSKIVL